ncbi:BofC C-terminal domain-containing protein [Paenibacillus tengchongensis]|uniref:BofC C-terminal domain-containing protein n=1 Tax=Paenibacillus tengchongensis TaxID=2608684 RepID=UPI0016529EAF|nr:BofC C-terminal domain-containing protein [Paenibacillus tengchongensis]
MKKQLWRRWRRWKNAPWVGAACIVLTLLAWRGMQVPETMSRLLSRSAINMTNVLGGRPGGAGESSSIAAVAPAAGGGEEVAPALEREELLDAIVRENHYRRVHLQTTYVSGEEVTTLPGERSPAEQKLLVEGHPGWNGWISSDGSLWLEHTVNDLSPVTKKDAYIGVDEQGNLTLFKGRPAADKALKTFFQMDMGSMKSSLPEEIWEQLHQGIRVQDIEEYNSVLSTFSDYARDSAEQAMQRKQ